AQSESRPNKVKYHGAPAPTKTASGSLGVVRRRASRSDSDASTHRARRASGAVTVGVLHGTGPSTPVTAGRRSSKLNLHETDAEPPGGTVSFHVNVTSSATVISAPDAASVVSVSSVSHVIWSPDSFGEGTELLRPPAFTMSIRVESGTMVTVTVSSVGSLRRDSNKRRSSAEVVATSRSKIARKVESTPG